MAPTTRTTALLALGAMAAVNIIWGAAFPISKPAFDDIPPITFAFLRFIVALVIMVPFAAREMLHLLRGPERRQLLLMGAIGFCVTQITQTEALALSPATHIALMAATSPLWVAMMAAWWLDEPFTLRMKIGTAIALIGIVIVLNPRDGLAGDWKPWLGYAIYLVSSFAWASYNVMGRSVMQRQKALPVTATAALIGVVCLAPFAGIEYLSGMRTVLSPTAVTGVLYTAIMVTVVGYVALFWALTKADSARVSAMMYLQPIAGVAVAWWWLGEQPGLGFFIGSALTFWGVWLVSTLGRSAIPTVISRTE
jgi:drug/metabolite transporter (DMT)-like permease